MVAITGEARGAILAHAREAWPAECCGLLLGREDRIERAIPARNLAESSATRFLLDPADHIRARRSARDAGELVLGFYHSHPDSAPVPSPTDVDEASYPEAIHVIAGAGPSGRLSEIRAFRIVGGRVRAVALGGG
ncbi:MAG TPA: M67 family metallopeptidase [Vicinamibacterales bacterium]|jgi:proteasome lid subunit RPN8/RPN11